MDSPFKIDVISTNFPRGISTSNRWRIDEDVSIGKSDKKDDDSVQTLTPNTPKETPSFPIQSETPLLQNVKAIPKPSAQQETLTFE